MIEQTINEICAKHKVSQDELLSHSREGRFIPPRRALARILRAQGLTLIAIGSIMNRDHTSILHYLGKTKKAQQLKRAHG